MLIGVYSSHQPSAVLPKERLDALLDEASKQGVELIFFDDAGIELTSGSIRGRKRVSAHWSEEGNYPLPKSVIAINPLPVSQQSEQARKLAQLVPFSSHVINGKYDMYQKMLKSTDLASLIMPTHVITGMDTVLHFLREYPHAIIKPDLGRQGHSIVGIKSVSEGSYTWQERAEVTSCSTKELEQRLIHLLAQGVMLIQPYQHIRTKKDEPFDFRVHVQRDGEGLWRVTHVYPRIGAPGSLISNLSGGGRTVPLDVFFQEEYPEQHPFLGLYLKQLGLNIAEHLDSFYPFDLDELGIDLVIDRSRRTWFYEANTSPQTRFHERERAAHTIAYALYLARQSSSLQLQNNYSSNKSESTEKYVIGMLAPVHLEQSFAEACNAVAKLYNAEFYYFHPKNVKMEQQMIIGRVFEDGVWVKKPCPLPDVVYDRFKRRGIIEYEVLYDSLSDIPFTHELEGGSLSKERVYDWLSQHPLLADTVIPYMSVEDAPFMLEFTDKHGKIVIKPAVGSHGKSIIIIQKREQDYELFDQQFLHYLSRIEFEAFLQMFCNQGYVAQRHVDSSSSEGFPFHLRTHMMRDGDGNWAVVFIQPFISLSSARQVTNHQGTLRLASKWEWFLSSQYGEALHMEMDRKLKAYALKAADYLSECLGKQCHEIALDIGVDSDRSLWLFEANFNQIGNTFHGFEAARFAIPFALHLAKNKKNRANAAALPEEIFNS
ncbi:YheC/YheD family protein [Paenibacillus hexagrammi]|uniref:YheC/YheD family protein n=1 Tax=Paenibacillus hexagrammi TaxID=2908839 RepID=A0ABY3SE34_9BACL|nr:YheC/YheD family protein [Paenibacillus sp. YPD9-1]UJF32253.1 YheC/YheD family protein [Paenibacillus sp. YPD9-1]